MNLSCNADLVTHMLAAKVQYRGKGCRILNYQLGDNTFVIE